MLKLHLTRVAWISFAFAVLAGAIWWLCENRYYYLARNFREVEPGRIYAGGYQHPRPMRRIIDRHRIKTVLSLAWVGEANEVEEDRTMAEAGVPLVRMWLPQHVADDERLDAVGDAVAFMTDLANQPIYVHCWGGRHRTGVVVGVYRLRHCGWSEETALRELLRYGGDEEGATWPTRLLREYARQARDVANAATDAATKR
jgi:hypothetical protein